MKFFIMKLHENECRNYIRHFSYYAVFTILLILINTIFSDKRFPWGLLIVFVWSITVLIHAAVLIALTVRSQESPDKAENGGKAGDEEADDTNNSRGTDCEN